MPRSVVTVVFPALCALFACSMATLGGCSPSTPARTPEGVHAETGRTYGLFVPDVAKGAKVPLVVVLHGYSIDGEREVKMLHFDTLAREKGFALAWPNGTKDKNGWRFWNATDACCNWFNSKVDDVAYLDHVIDEVAERHPIDRTRVYVVGHSNGAFMAHRYACDRSERVAAIATLAGVPALDAATCAPKLPVSVLHMQGTKDPAISPDGGRIDGRALYPGTVATIQGWVKRNRCQTNAIESAQLFDFDTKVAGPETRKSTYEGCAGGSTVELWWLEGSEHEPDGNAAFTQGVYAFLSAHTRQ